MTNIAFQDIAGGSIKVYSKNSHLPKWDRIKLALQELNSVGCIKVYLYKRRKLRLIMIKGY